jgi:transposase-like protein
MAERRYRKFTAEQKLEIVIAGLRSGNVQEVCRSNDISSALYYSWRDQVLEAGKERLAGKDERQGQAELKKRRSPGSNGRWARRPTSWSWRETSCGSGSKTTRGLLP